MKKQKAIFLFIITLLLASCEIPNSNNRNEYKRFRSTFIGLFDTHSIIMGYATSEEEFNYFRDIIYNELYRLNQLFDIYNEYENINNLKTINDNAGISEVKVDPVIINLIKYSKELHTYTNGLVNIALGPVIKIWNEYRLLSSANPSLATLPNMKQLQHANNYTNINDVIIDEENNKVFLKHQNMSLDVGSIAKGFSIELVSQKAIEAGFESFVISVGGDIRTSGAPLAGSRNQWSIGIQHPNLSIHGTQNIIDNVYVTNNSVFTSGDYQRFFVVNGEVYHHIIDPTTLMPANKYRAVSVIYPNAATADALSTAVFILNIQQGKKILEEFGAQAIWILHDNSTIYTEGFKNISNYYS